MSAALQRSGGVRRQPKIKHRFIPSLERLETRSVPAITGLALTPGPDAANDLPAATNDLAGSGLLPPPSIIGGSGGITSGNAGGSAANFNSLQVLLNSRFLVPPTVVNGNGVAAINATIPTNTGFLFPNPAIPLAPSLAAFASDPRLLLTEAGFAAHVAVLSAESASVPAANRQTQPGANTQQGLNPQAVSEVFEAVAALGDYQPNGLQLQVPALMQFMETTEFTSLSTQPELKE